MQAIELIRPLVMGASLLLAAILATFMVLLPLLLVIIGLGLAASSLTFWRVLANLGSPYAAYVLASMLDQRFVGSAKEEAIVWYRRAFERGYPTAALNLGFMLLNGPTACRDYVAAERYLRRAWELGYAQALIGLSTLYEYGKTGVRDQAYAFELSQTAVAMGLVDAHNNVGYFYSNGGPVEIDRRKAFEHFIVAARAGNAAAQSNVANHYRLGEGVEEDHLEAWRWMRRAARNGSQEASVNLWKYSRTRMTSQFLRTWVQVALFDKPTDRISLAYCYLTGHGVKRNPERALVCFAAAASAGESEAYVYIGGFHERRSNWDQAIEAYQEGAQNGNVTCMLALSRVFKLEATGRRDPARAIEWLQAAADKGEVDARAWLSDVYMDETWEGHDLAKGMSVLREVAEAGNALAQSKLGYRLTEGKGIEKNETEAVHWLRAAADQGQAAAQHNLAECYEFGTGVAIDLVQALFWYKVAHFDLAESAQGLWRVQDKLSPEDIKATDAKVLDWLKEKRYSFDPEALPGYLNTAF